MINNISEGFRRLKCYFEAIEQGQNIDQNAKFFTVTLNKIVREFELKYVFELNTDEIILVQQWARKIMGNEKVSKAKRVQISVANLSLYEMNEELDIIKTHTL